MIVLITSYGGVYLVYQFIIAAYFVKKYQDHFRDHVVACEYLQIDPSKAYDIEFIRSRTHNVLSQWTDGGDPALTEEMRRTLERYLKAMSAGAHGTHAAKNVFCGTVIKAMTPSETFAERCVKLTAEGRMRTLPGTVSETYVKKDLGHENFDYYMSKLPRWPN
jgi:hypothetical protein